MCGVRSVARSFEATEADIRYGDLTQRSSLGSSLSIPHHSIIVMGRKDSLLQEWFFFP